MRSEDRIKELEKENQQLRELLQTDELTKILNRRGLQERLNDMVEEVLYNQKNPDQRKKIHIDDLCLIFLDLDDFKKINDEYGHDVGDEALERTGAILSKSVRGIDISARLGGEEFVVVLVGANEEEGLKKATDFKDMLQKVDFEKYPDITLTGSFGVASMAKSSCTSSECLISVADKAMYEAKKNRGKNSVVAYSELVD